MEGKSRDADSSIVKFLYCSYSHRLYTGKDHVRNIFVVGNCITVKV